MDQHDIEMDAAAAQRLRCHRIAVVAEILDLSTSSVRRLIRDGHLKSIQLGGSVRISAESLETLLKAGTRRTPARGKK